jgi:Prokaryotic E2 family D
MQNEALILNRRDDPAKALVTPLQTDKVNPGIDFCQGQFLARLPNEAGGLSEKFVSDAAVREAFSGIPVGTGWFNLGLTCPGVCRWGDGSKGEWAVLYVPPASHRLEISNDGSGLPYAVERLDVPLPALAFFGLGPNYWVFALKTDHLSQHHEIYRCPLPNVMADGAVCWGHLKPPRATATTIVEAWRLFAESTFNNHMANAKSRREREDVRALLRALAAGGGPYPVEDLVRQHKDGGMTLDRALREFFETGEMPG